MPTAENNGEIRVPFFDSSRNLNCLANHVPRDERDAEAYSIANLFEYTLLIVWRDRRINEGNLISGTNQRGRDCQSSEWRRCLRTRKGRKEKNHFLGSGSRFRHRSLSTNVLR